MKYLIMHRLEIQLRYKRETGQVPVEEILEFYRSKEKWILEPKYNHLMERANGTFLLASMDDQYIEWLEETIEQLTKGKNEGNQ